jgi:tetratricopeptide (TPR) repeat protein
MAQSDPLRIFVAMPGTDMGPNASYKKPESVKANLLEPIREKLETRLERRVELIIEMDKLQPGVIYESMYAEAHDADVYIADLTGANPNVYLELGVRWALRDYVTVPISQSREDVRFNVGANRVIFYNPDNIVRATDQIVSTIETGLRKKICDSPVRLNGKFITIPKSERESLDHEIERLRKELGEDLLRAAKATKDAEQRLTLLRQVVESNPAYAEARLELGRAYRQLSRYDDAVKELTAAQGLEPDNPVVYRELGVCYSKMGKPELAAEALREAVRLDPGNGEAWSNLGGALRRIGMAKAPASYDQKALEEARESYAHAHKLDGYNLYAGLNVARLDLLLSKWEPLRLPQAREAFRKQLNLCRFKVDEDPKDYWRHFDLADALLFCGCGQHDEALQVFDRAVELVPKERRKDTLQSVLGPLQDYLLAGVLQGALEEEVKRVVGRLEASIPS